MVLPLVAGVAASIAGDAIGDALTARRQPLASSWISEAAWANGTLTLTMNGKTYDWPDPDAALYEGITHAASPGRFFNANLKGAAGGSSSVPRALARWPLPAGW